VNITYAYDAAGRRVSRSDGVNTVYYLYNGLNLIEERDGLNNVLAEYIYDGALLPRKTITGGNEYYFQQDVLGNVTALTDENGEIVETYEYDIYGKPSIYDENGNPVATPMTPFLFTGHYWDGDIGLYLTMYRAYSPELGRWLTRDPIDFSGGDINLYRYVGNSVIDYYDLDGLSKGCCEQRRQELQDKIDELTRMANNALNEVREMEESIDSGLFLLTVGVFVTAVGGAMLKVKGAAVTAASGGTMAPYGVIVTGAGFWVSGAGASRYLREKEARREAISKRLDQIDQYLDLRDWFQKKLDALQCEDQED
jgi:RHS repeat-associated protein